MPSDLSGETIRKIFIFCLILLFSAPFGYYYGLVYWGNGTAGLAAGGGIGIVFTTLGLIFANKISGLFLIFFAKRESGYSQREQLESDIQQVRYHKMREEYNVALRKVNEILKLDPEFPDALFLKAQIVWEGFGNSDAAISNLEKIETIVSEKSAIRRWTRTLLEEIGKSTNGAK